MVLARPIISVIPNPREKRATAESRGRPVLTHLCLVLLAMTMLAASPAADSGNTAAFAPPGAELDATALRSAEQEMRDAKWAAAAGHIDLLLKDSADDLAVVEEGRLMSMQGWLRSLPVDLRKNLAARGGAAFEAAAGEQLESLRNDRTARPEELYKLALRYPFTRAAATALTEAANRALRLGDLGATETYTRLARELGASPTEIRADPGSAAPRYVGPAVFPANWWERVDQINRARYFPQYAGGVFYLVGARGAMALREDGSAVWRWQAVDAVGRASADRPNAASRGTPYEPALVVGPAGAVMLVSRQPRPGVRDFCLRALRASDGKLLWSTESQPAAQDLSFVSNPAVSGKFVYAVAVQFAERSATLVLAGLDITDGKLLFQTPLGTLTDMRQQRQETSGWDGFWEQTSPAVSADAVYVTPNVGWAFAVERFGGELLWAKRYADPPHPLPPAELLRRYRTTPYAAGEVVMIAPQDSADSWGLSARTGQVLWHAGSASGQTLIGGEGDVAVTVGANLAGVGMADGRPMWNIDAARKPAIAGPPALVGGLILAMRGDGSMLTVSCRTGEPAVALPWKTPDFRAVVRSSAGRPSLMEGLMIGTFGQ
jgi:outer membrane protein assembly factor BamB